jgi:CHAT domain-containing protein
VGGKLEALSMVRQNLAALVFGGRAQKGEAKDRNRDEDETGKTAAELTARKEALERELYRLSADFRDEKTLMAAGAADICARLKPSEVLLDYLRYDRYTPADAKTGAGEVIEPSYLAFVLRGGADCGRPERVEIGPSGIVDRAVGKYRGLVKDRKSTKSVDSAAAEVRRLIWDPLAARVGAREWVWIVPDGTLSGVPFGALPRGQEYLAEKHVLSYLGSAADLTRLQPTAYSLQPVGALLVGGMDYDAVPPGAPAAAAGRGDSCGLLESFKKLQGAEQEVRDIAAILSTSMDPALVKTVTGAAATEAEIKRHLSGRKVVHLATHGFFSEIQCGPASLNPMIRSGVVFSGANARRGGGEYDGVLSAEEVVGLELHGTELVVLSACETGLGEVIAGEGVMGLRRAFALAGARSLVMSLWKVPDESTRRLMREFYLRIAAKPETPKPAALRDAQLVLLRDNRERLLDPEPHTWAGFIISGR